MWTFQGRIGINLQRIRKFNCDLNSSIPADFVARLEKWIPAFAGMTGKPMQTLAICKGCSANKPHHAHGYCTNCYHKFMVRKTGAFDKASLKQKQSAKLKEQWSQEERINSKLPKDQLEDLYCVQKMSMGDIAKLHNCSKVYVMLLLRKYDLPVRTKSAARAEAKKKGKNVGFSAINENFFKNHTPEMAYVLGFIYSDGNIGNLLDHFSISQKEPEILYKIRSLMLSEHQVVRRSNQEIYLLTIGNKVMISDLLAFGLTPNKSLDVKFPVLDENLYSHFIRGYFDGDGSIYTMNKQWRIGFVSGSKLFMDSLEEALYKYVGLSRRKAYVFPNGKAFQVTYFRRLDIVKLFHFLYDDLSLKNKLYLSRKYEMFIKSFNSRITGEAKQGRIIGQGEVEALEKAVIRP